MAQRILVVEDDQFLRELYNELLRDEGYDVDLAPDGEEGLAKILKGGYDLVYWTSCSLRSMVLRCFAG